jgi:hypothetical protein
MATEPTVQPGERSLGQLVAQASADMGDIMRAELALAKAELKADAKHGALAGGLFGAAGYIVMLASVLLTIAAGYGIAAIGLAPGWAFLILGVAYLLFAALLGLVGKSRISKVGPPERAIRSTKETIAAIKPGSRTR